MHYRIDDSDLFKRFLILSVLEKIPEENLREDLKRLEGFQSAALSAMTFGSCCTDVRSRQTVCS
jgi:hypothetical protein